MAPIQSYSPTARQLFLLLFWTLTTFTGDLLAQPTFERYPTDSVYSTLISGDTLYVGGGFDGTGVINSGLAIYNTTTKAVDSTWPQVTNRTGALQINAIEPDGSGGFYIGGKFSHVGSTAQGYLAHIKSDKTLDALFVPQFNDAIYALKLQSGVLYVGGVFTQVNSTTRRGLVAVSAITGETDSSISAAISTTNGYVRTIIAYGGNLFVGGLFSSVVDSSGTLSRHGLAQIDVSTGRFSSFDTKVKTTGVTGGTVYALTIFNSKLYIGGSFTRVQISVTTTTRNNFAVINPDTGALLSYAPEPNSVVYGLSASATELYIQGDFITFDGQTRYRLASISTAEALTSFAPTLDDTAYSSTLISSTELFVGGKFKAASASTRKRGASFSTTDASLQSFDPAFDGSVTAATVVDSNLVLGGSFNLRGCTSNAGLLAYNLTTGALIPEVSFSLDGAVYSLAKKDGAIYVVGTFTTAGGQARNRGFSFLESDYSVTGWNPNANGAAYRILIVDTAAYMTGDFTSLAGSTRNYVGAVTTGATATLTSFNPGANSSTFALYSDGTYLYVGGAFTTISSTSRNLIARYLLSDFSLDSWNPSLTGNSIADIAGNSSGIAIAGDFTAVGATPALSFALLSTSTAESLLSDRGLDGTLSALYADTSKILIGGTFTTISSGSRTNLAQISVAGTLSNWTPQAGPTGAAVNSISFIDDSRMIIGGSSLLMNGSSSPRIAVIQSELANTSVPTISTSSAVQGALFSATTGSWTGIPTIAYSYQWQRCSDTCVAIASATSSTYTTTVDDVGYFVRVVVTATNSTESGSASSALSSAIDPVASEAPVASGLTYTGNYLSCSEGGWSNASGLSFTYQWYRCDSSDGACSAISGSTSSTYKLLSDDVGSTVRCGVQATKGSSTSVASDRSALLAVVTSGPPAPTAKVIKNRVKITVQSYNNAYTTRLRIKPAKGGAGYKKSKVLTSSRATFLKVPPGTYSIFYTITDSLTGVSKSKSKKVVVK